MMVWRRLLCGALLAAALMPVAAAQTPAPRVLVRSIDSVTLLGRSALLDLTVQVRDPGPLALPLQKLRFGLQLDGTAVGQGESTAPVTVPAGGHADIPVTLHIDGPTLMQIILALPPNLTVHYRIAGTAEIGQTMLQIPFAEEGEVRLPVQ